LFVGTQADNAKDKAKKGRSVRLFFDDNGSGKLKRADMQFILAATSRGETQKAIAKKLGVTQTAIWRKLANHRGGVYERDHGSSRM